MRWPVSPKAVALLRMQARPEAGKKWNTLDRWRENRERLFADLKMFLRNTSEMSVLCGRSQPIRGDKPHGFDTWF
ncbi:MAG: hypothetical protein JO094_17280 [Hyphomicrobiales bacterium]|nr:hypothetical protein [Hyphomicrobiales bacterium]